MSDPAVLRVREWLEAYTAARTGEDLLDYRGGRSLTVGDIERLVLLVRRGYEGLAVGGGGSELLAQAWDQGRAAGAIDPNPYRPPEGAAER